MVSGHVLVLRRIRIVYNTSHLAVAQMGFGEDDEMLPYADRRLARFTSSPPSPTAIPSKKTLPTILKNEFNSKLRESLFSLLRDFTASKQRLKDFGETTRYTRLGFSLHTLSSLPSPLGTMMLSKQKRNCGHSEDGVSTFSEEEKVGRRLCNNSRGML